MNYPRLLLLVSARKNSKYLAKFLFSHFQKTVMLQDTEALVMMSKNDTWNRDLADYFMFTKCHNGKSAIRFYFEDHKLGRAGLHVYFNDLLKQATNYDWLVYFCDDHCIANRGWDVELNEVTKNLNPDEPWCIVPKFDNAGAMNHVLSRGYIEAMGQLGNHGNIDSYLNEVNNLLPPERIILVDEEWFHDFTHDNPSPMSEEHLKGPISEEAKQMPALRSTQVARMIMDDAGKVRQKILELERGLSQ